MPRKLPYKEGDWFLVPLTTSGFGLGRVARLDRKGIVLGYFFGEKYLEWPDEAALSALWPYDARWVAQFGHLGILEGVWPVHGSSKWERTAWSVPQFVRRGQKDAELVTYTDDLRLSTTRRCSLKEASQHPRDGLSGDGAVEAVLTQIVENTLTPYIKENVDGTRAFLRSLKSNRQ